MRLFFHKIAVFTFYITSIFTAIIFLINYQINQVSKFKTTPNIKYIVLGHSHPQHAYNDSIISNFKNFSYAAESYFYTLIKARKIIDQNNNIEIVFIEFTNNQIITEMDTWTWGDRASFKYKILTPFMNLNEHLFILRNNPQVFLNNLSISTRYALENLISNNVDYSEKIGWYTGLKKKFVNSMLSDQDNDNSHLEYVTKISLNNILYLKSLINYCENHGKKVFLIRSPVHQKYPMLSNEPVYKKILKSYFNKQEYLDFLNFPLSNSEFGDLHHINYIGASKFSKWIDRLLKDGLLSRKDKQKVIDERIKSFEID